MNVNINYHIKLLLYTTAQKASFCVRQRGQLLNHCTDRIEPNAEQQGLQEDLGQVKVVWSF